MADRESRDGDRDGAGVRWVVADPGEGDTPADVIEFGSPSQRRWYRHRVVTIVAASAVCAAVAWSVVSRDMRAPEPKPTAATSAPVDGADLLLGSVRTDVLRPGDERTLPERASPLPRNIGASIADVVPLSESPVSRASAVFYGLPPHQDRVVVLGEDGRWRWLDGVTLTGPAGQDGIERPLVRPTTLSPDGTRAAFTQRNEIVVVDLTTAKSRRYPLRGFHELVIWQPDNRRLFAVSVGDTFLLDIHSGQSMDLPYQGMHLIAAQGGGVPVTELLPPGVAAPGAPAQLRTWSGTGTAMQVVGVDLPSLGGWWGIGWQLGQLIARGVFYEGVKPGTTHLSPAVAIVDPSGQIRRVVAFVPGPAAEWHSPPLVLGWLPGTALIEVVGEQARHILSWNVGTGDLARVAELPLSAQVSLPDLTGL